MSNELIVLAGLIFSIVTTCLVIIDYLRKSTKKEPVVIDYFEYIRHKAKGDVIDRSIAQLLDIETTAA